MCNRASGVLGKSCSDTEFQAGILQPPCTQTMQSMFPMPMMMPGQPYMPGQQNMNFYGQFQQQQQTIKPQQSATSVCTNESSDESSESSTSSSDDSEDDIDYTKPVPSPYYNFDYCTCDAPLPDAYKPPTPKKKKPVRTAPRAGLWCGSDKCAVLTAFPPNSKAVRHEKFKIPKAPTQNEQLPPSVCCFKNDQLIFQMPDKGTKSDKDNLPFYNVGPDETPVGVTMVKPEGSPQADPDNNTYLLTIMKTDANGKPAKMELAIKIPRVPDMSVSETERTVQYDPNDQIDDKKRKESRKSRRSRRSRSKGKSWVSTKSWSKSSKSKNVKKGKPTAKK